MRVHDRQPDRNHIAGNERKTTRETKKDERVSNAKKEDER